MVAEHNTNDAYDAEPLDGSPDEDKPVLPLDAAQLRGQIRGFAVFHPAPEGPDTPRSLAGMIEITLDRPAPTEHN